MSSNLTNELNELIEKFTRFRQDLYDCFDARQDTVMDLLGGTVSQSFVSPRWSVRSIKPSKKLLPRTSLSQTTPAQKHPLSRCVPALAQVIPAPQARPYLVLGLDATPNPRPYAPTLKDRTFIYQPNPIKGNKPINIGHPYSILSVLPEKTPHQSGTWVIPLSGVRVESELPGKGSWLTTNQRPAQSPSFF